MPGMANAGPRTLAELRALPLGEQSLLLLARLAVVSQMNGASGLHKGNLLLPGDSSGLAVGYDEREKSEVIRHLLGLPWTTLVNRGFLVDPEGNGFYSLTDEGREAARNLSSGIRNLAPSALPHGVDFSVLLKWVIAHPNEPFDPNLVVGTMHTTDWEWQAVLEQMETLRKRGYITKLKQDGSGGSTYWNITTAGEAYLHALENAENAAATDEPPNIAMMPPAETAGQPANNTASRVSADLPEAELPLFSSDDLSIDLASISDAPTTDDNLGFGPYVTAIAKFLLSTHTSGPLTLSIEGEWGSGKSSFMKQLDRVLAAPPTALTTEERRPPVTRTFWFNAWRQDKQEAVWAAFALAFSRELRSKAQNKWKASICLAYQRFRANPDLSGAALALLKSTTWVAGGVLCFAALRTLGASRLKWVFSSTAAVATLVQVVKYIREMVGSPFETHISNYLRGPDYGQRVAFVEQFHDDFKRMLNAYAQGVDKIFVFIDDVDRCEVPKAAELMQAFNLLIGDDNRLVFVIGMDREMVAAGIAAKYKDLAPFLYGNEEAKCVGYGFSFLEKFIQIPFQIPVPNVQRLGKFFEKLSISTDSSAASDSLPPPMNATIATKRPGDAMAADSPPSTAKNRVERDLEFAGDSARVRGVAGMVAATVQRSPRKLKQFMNVFRLKAHIANQLGLFDDDNDGKQQLTFEQLGKFVAVSLSWPRLIADLSANPWLLATLEEAACEVLRKTSSKSGANDGAVEKTQMEAAQTKSAWEKIPQLMALLQYGCVPNSARPTWPQKASRYSFQDVDLIPMIEISPQLVIEPRKKAAPPSVPAKATSDEVPASESNSELTDTRKRFSNRTILWVDDRPEMIQEIVDNLEDEGATIELALTTKDGLNRFRNMPVRPLAIITDLHRVEDGEDLPLAGIDFIRQVEVDDPAIPIIIFTSARGINRAKEHASDLQVYGATASTTELLGLLDELMGGKSRPSGTAEERPPLSFGTSSSSLA
jgi:CheY-like chemotaxis protein